MIELQSLLSNRVFLNVFLSIFIVKTQILECKAECTSVNSRPSSKEQKLLDTLKPLFGHTFETKDLVNPSNYSYKISICDNVKGQKDGVGAVQFTQNGSFILGKYNQVEIIGGNNWMFLTYYGGKTYNHHCNNAERVTKIMISCLPDVLYGKLEILEERHSNVTDCYYLFELESNVSCTTFSKKEDNSHMSFGGVFCILFFTFGSLYLLLGFLYKRFVIGAKGLEQIPNYSFWKEFGNLQADGCDFLCRCGPRQESQAYRGIDDHLKMEDERDDQLLNM